MAPSNKSPTDRQQTDHSLRAERLKTDEELAKARKDIQEDADEVVNRARLRADETLAAARSKADAKLKRAGASAKHHAAAREEYATEDAALQKERATADAELEDEREQRRRALALLLHLEREQTDKHLLIERARSDNALAKRDDFLGIVSHDLRTLLGGIALSAARLIRNAPTDDAGRRTIKIADGIQRYVAQTNRIIGDLIDMTSIEAGRLVVTPEQHDAVTLTQDVMELFQPLAAEKEVSLESEVIQAPLLAKFDHERILQVLSNLLSNAIKFTPAGGHISLRVMAVAAEVRFSVTDTGEGIPQGKMHGLFQRFWQAAPDDRRGLGLGLFISKSIVEAHGGRIWVESSSPQGSTFCFTLPAAPEPQSDR